MILLDEVATQVLTFSVTVDGTALPSTVMISALRTHQSSSAPSEAEITVLVQSDDGFDPAPFKLLSIGAGVSVRLGYDGVEDIVFSGSIAGQELTFSDNGARLIVTCSGDPVPPVSDETAHELRLGVDVESYRGSIGASGSDATGELQMQGSGHFRKTIRT